MESLLSQRENKNMAKLKSCLALCPKLPNIRVLSTVGFQQQERSAVKNRITFGTFSFFHFINSSSIIVINK